MRRLFAWFLAPALLAVALVLAVGVSMAATPRAQAAGPTPSGGNGRPVSQAVTAINPDVARVAPVTSNPRPAASRAKAQSSDVGTDAQGGRAPGPIGLAAGAGAASAVLIVGVALRAFRTRREEQ